MVKLCVKALSKKLISLESEKTTGKFFSNQKIEKFILDILSILFPLRGFREELNVNNLSFFIEKKRLVLMSFFNRLKVQDDEFLADKFFSELPNLKIKLKKDALFILEEDPAANSIDEVILCYPGFFALAVYRMANFFFEHKVSLLPRMMTELAHEKTGIDIHPGASLGCPLFLDHGTGIVVGETSRVGNYTKIFQGVTLGALSVEKELKKKLRHPTIGEHCVIYSNATILGGKTSVGHHSIIGGNVWLTEPVPAHSLIFHEKKKLRQVEKKNCYA